MPNSSNLPVAPPSNCQASQMTWNLGAGFQDRYFHDREWRHEIFKKHPPRFSKEMAKIYSEIYTQKGRYAANTFLRETDKIFSSLKIGYAGNEDAIRAKSKELAKTCMYFCNKKQFRKNQIVFLRDFVGNYGLKIPEKTRSGIIKRLCDELWWRRNLRKKFNRGLEKAALSINLVNKKRGKYVSDENLKSFQQQTARNINILRRLEVVNELDQVYSLESIVESSLSNPAVRRAELMARIHGIEQYAKEQGLVGEFYTITCPSRMHAALSKSSARNPKFDGTTALEAQKYLTRLWSQIRAKLARDNLTVFGIRVVEPHHDGAPHWHLLLFMRPEHSAAVTNILRDYALRESPDEPGAKLHRFTRKQIDWERGTATGYIAKYISKNIDGAGLGSSEVSESLRVRAWASLHGVRQFQFIGGPSVGIWREMRRMSVASTPNDSLIREAVKAADGGDWKSYIGVTGGIQIKNSQRQLQLLKVWSDKEGRYGEPRGYVTQGVVYENINYLSRVHTWSIRPKSPEECEQAERAFTEGSDARVNEVKLPPSGLGRAGGACFSPGSPGPAVKAARPLEFCQ